MDEIIRRRFDPAATPLLLTGATGGATAGKKKKKSGEGRPRAGVSAAALAVFERVLAQAALSCELMRPAGYEKMALGAEDHYRRGVRNLRDAALNMVRDECAKSGGGR